MKGRMHRKKCWECRKDFYCLAPNDTCFVNEECLCFLCAAKRESKLDWMEFRYWVGSCYRNIDGKKRLWIMAKIAG